MPEHVLRYDRHTKVVLSAIINDDKSQKIIYLTNLSMNALFNRQASILLISSYERIFIKIFLVNHQDL